MGGAENMNPLLEGFEKRLIGQNRTEQTRRIYLNMAARLLDFVGEDLGEEQVLRFRDELAAKVDQNSMNTYAFALNAFLEYRGMGFRVEPPKKIHKEADSLSKSEFAKVLDAASRQQDVFRAKRDTAILMIMGEGAARGGELRALRMRDLDLSKGVVLARRPKGKHDRRIFFGDATRKALASYLEVRGTGATAEDELCLFLNQDGTRIHGHDTLRVMLAKLAADARLDRKIHPHMLRHMRITELSEQGMNPFQLQRFAGHADVKTTMGYVHVQDDAIATFVQASPAVRVVDDHEGQGQPEDLKKSLTRRLALGEISEDTYRRALNSLEADPLEALR